MQVSLRQVTESSRHVLENLFRYYVYDMSGFTESELDENGIYTFNPSSLNVYWERVDHVPYFIYVNSLLAGFSLIRKYPNDTKLYDIEQFFVLRKHRSNGVGTLALEKLTFLHKGFWQIRVLEGNQLALNFWKSAILKIAGSNFKLRKDIDVDLEMYFLSFESNS